MRYYLRALEYVRKRKVNMNIKLITNIEKHKSFKYLKIFKLTKITALPKFKLGYNLRC